MSDKYELRELPCPRCKHVHLLWPHRINGGVVDAREMLALLNARPVEQPGEKRACMRMDGTHEPWCTAATPPAPSAGASRDL